MPELLGQVGDFFGGVLNPVIAIFALGMLMRSYRLQKKELAGALQAMRDQEKVQLRLVESLQIGVRLQILTAMVNSIAASARFEQTAIDTFRLYIKRLP